MENLNVALNDGATVINQRLDEQKTEIDRQVGIDNTLQELVGNHQLLDLIKASETELPLVDGDSERGPLVSLTEKGIIVIHNYEDDIDVKGDGRDFKMEYHLMKIKGKKILKKFMVGKKAFIFQSGTDAHLHQGEPLSKKYGQDVFKNQTSDTIKDTVTKHAQELISHLKSR